MQDQKQLTRKSNDQAKTILVVEDDSDMGYIIISILEEIPQCHTILAHDGFQALKYIDTAKPDLVLLDYQLPGINGLELYQRFHQQKELEHIPVIFMSANLNLEKVKEHQLLCLMKPFDLDELLTMIQSLLSSPCEDIKEQTENKE